MHWISLIHEFHNLIWITEINELFHNILIYWDAPVLKHCEWLGLAYYILWSIDSIYIYIVTNVPSPNQRCPGNSRGAPAHQSSQADRPHLRFINPSAHKQRAHRRTERKLSMRQQTNILSVPFQTAACDRPAQPHAPHWLTRIWTRLRVPQQARAQTPFTLTNKIHPLGT